MQEGPFSFAYCILSPCLPHPHPLYNFFSHNALHELCVPMCVRSRTVAEREYPPCLTSIVCCSFQLLLKFISSQRVHSEESDKTAFRLFPISPFFHMRIYLVLCFKCVRDVPLPATSCHFSKDFLNKDIFSAAERNIHFRENRMRTKVKHQSVVTPPPPPPYPQGIVVILYFLPAKPC